MKIFARVTFVLAIGIAIGGCNLVGKDTSEFVEGQTTSIPCEGLDFLVANQNADGSWGTNRSGVFITSFALTAFFNYDETLESGLHHHRQSIRRGLEWLVRQTPKNDMDTVCMLHALTAADHLNKGKGFGARALKLRKSLATRTLQDPERLLLLITIPADQQQNSDPSPRTHQGVRASMLSNPRGPEPLRLYLKTLHAFVTGGDVWESHNRDLLRPLLRARREDRSFRLDGASSRVEATVFSLLSLTVCYRYWDAYISLDHSSGTEEEETRSTETHDRRQNHRIHPTSQAGEGSS